MIINILLCLRYAVNVSHNSLSGSNCDPMTLDSPPLLALLSELDLVTDSPQPAITLNKAHVHSLNKHLLKHLLGARQCSVLGLPPQDT